MGWSGYVGVFQPKLQLDVLPKQAGKKNTGLSEKNGTPFNLMVESQHHHTPHHSMAVQWDTWPSFADNRQGIERPKKGLGEMMYVWTPAHSHESLTIKYRNMATMNHETKTWGKAKNTALKYWTTELAKKYPKSSTLSLFNIAMENDHLQLIFPLKMVIFYSYVSLP